MLQVRPLFSRSKVRISAAALAIVALGAGVLWLVPRRSAESHNPELQTPVLALAALSAESLYFNAAARPWLLQQRPELLTKEDRDERSERSRDFAQAVQNPKLFRRLDRRDRFDTLLLVGDPSQYRPLLEHLLEAQDWTLQALDHTSIVYKRGPVRAWQPSDLAAEQARFPKAEEQAQFLAQAAARLIAIRRGSEAKPLLDAAEALATGVPEIWTGFASYRMMRGEWALALTAADRALQLDRRSMAALATKTQILYSTKRFGEAFDLSSKLIDEYPDDPALLFYHAKICHEAHAFTAEIKALTRLIERAEAEDRPTTGYRTYLAQAYAADGQAEPSVREFRRVLADGEISAEQRRFAEETLTQIQSRSGVK